MARLTQHYFFLSTETKCGTILLYFMAKIKDFMYKFKEPEDAYEISRQFAKKGKAPGVISFPPYVTFEFVNACNFKCVMCPNSYKRRERQEMDFNLFKTTIDEIAKYGSLIRFIGYEEPLLYSKIKEAIKYVKGKGLLLHITTNGSLLNEEIIKIIIDSKVDSIIFSFQGLSKKEYCFMRNVNPKIYSKVINNVKLLYKYRENKKPFVKITTTATERDLLADKNRFIKEHLNYADEVQVSGFTHFVHIAEYYGKKNIWAELNITKPQKIEGVRCFTPNYEMLIKNDGGVYVCCGDYTDSLKIGNTRKKKLFDIWHSKEADILRKEVNTGNLDKFENCAVCPIRYKYKNMNSAAVNTRSGKAESFKK